MTPPWIYDAAFYHIYPLGLLDAPHRNDFTSPPAPRLERLHDWLDHIAELNLTAVYLGPVFESTSHGYDTVDYYQVDRRLGTNETLKTLIQAMKSRGLRVVLDGVFNHVGRDFWAFRDVLEKGQASSYADWFHRLDFSRKSIYGDPFSYEGWAGHNSLVKLNQNHPDVRQHLFNAVTLWINEFDIDGLRLDAADVLDHDFIRALAAHCRSLKSDFWLMGEVVHGDYRHWANPEMLDATTNYECYKGLYSSHVDKNYFEIAYSLNRQFGADGIYRDLLLYSFADNHDVNRGASSLTKAAHLYPLYILLATIPGIPSIYYGSEWGIPGQRTDHSDKMLRPALSLNNVYPHPDLAKTIQRLMGLRCELPPLRYGAYQQLYVAGEQFAFLRQTSEQAVIVAVNAADHPAKIILENLPQGGQLWDRLNGSNPVVVRQRTEITINPNWGGIFAVE